MESSCGGIEALIRKWMRFIIGLGKVDRLLFHFDNLGSVRVVGWLEWFELFAEVGYLILAAISIK